MNDENCAVPAPTQTPDAPRLKEVDATKLVDVELVKELEANTAAMPDDAAKPEPLTPTTADYVLSDEEATFRARKEPHRRLNRKMKPTITQERFEELERFAQTEQLRREDRVPYFLAKIWGVMTERDMRNLRDADTRRAKRRARNVRLHGHADRATQLDRS